MEKDNNKILQDLSRLANSALSTALQAKNDMAKTIRHHVETFIKKMNFITKREHDVVKKMVTQQSLDIKTLQQKVGMKSAAKRATAPASKIKAAVSKSSAGMTKRRPFKKSDELMIKKDSPRPPAKKKTAKPRVQS